MLFFGNTSCPYSRKVLAALEGKDFEFNEIPMDRSVRAKVPYKGKSKDFRGKTFGQIFEGNISIPKMIINGKKYFESDDMVTELEHRS